MTRRMYVIDRRMLKERLSKISELGGASYEFRCFSALDKVVQRINRKACDDDNVAQA